MGATAVLAQAQTRDGPAQCITNSPIEITPVTFSRGHHRDGPRRLQWGVHERQVEQGAGSERLRQRRADPRPPGEPGKRDVCPLYRMAPQGAFYRSWASGVTARSSRSCWSASPSPGQGQGGPGPSREGPGRQGLRLPRQPRLPAQTRDPVHDPGEGRPGPPPQEQGPGRRPPARFRPGRLQGQPCRGVRHRPAQAQPRRRHPL